MFKGQWHPLRTVRSSRSGSACKCTWRVRLERQRWWSKCTNPTSLIAKPRPLSKEQNSLGSSSGSCIAVSAGKAPIALGTETIGSLITLAVRTVLCTIKPTHGTTNSTKIVPITARYDTAGPIGKTSKDVANLLDILVDHEKANVPDGGYASVMV